MLDKNRVLTSKKGRSYTVLSEISSGTGQGDIYLVECEGERFAFKLFYAGEEAQTVRQIHILMKRGKACPAYVHPLDVVVADGRIGYVMEYIPERYLSGNVLVKGVPGEEGNEPLPFYVKLIVLRRLAEAISVLYNAGLAMMDLKFDNIKIDPDSREVKILDTDTIVSSKAGNSPVMGTVGFMPPLTMRRDEKPSRYNDSYALAVMIFMTMIGIHPLMGKLGEVAHECDNETYLFAEDPVYVMHPTDDRNRPTSDSVDARNRLAAYPKLFLDAMERTFVDGLFEGEKRTSPAEWCDILDAVYADSFCCLACGEEQFLSHRGSRVCAACGNALSVPILAVGDKAAPLFFGSGYTMADLWTGGDGEEIILRVVESPYGGKFGFVSETGDITLSFADGRRIDFAKGKTVPIFMNGTYKYKNKSFCMKEAS